MNEIIAWLDQRPIQCCIQYCSLVWSKFIKIDSGNKLTDAKWLAEANLCGLVHCFICEGAWSGHNAWNKWKYNCNAAYYRSANHGEMF